MLNTEAGVNRIRVVGLGLLLGCLMAPGGARAEESAATGGAMTAAVADGMSVEIDYTLTVDGQVVDTSEGRGPLRYTQGKGEIIHGLERQLAGLHTGDTKDVTVSPEDGYGMVNPEAFVDVQRSQLPPDAPPQVGQMLRGTGRDGQPFRARIHAIKDDKVTLDLNHPLAGKTLQFHVKVIGIQPGG